MRSNSTLGQVSGIRPKTDHFPTAVKFHGRFGGSAPILPEMSDTDMELLTRYLRQHAEDAFAELVRRHLGLGRDSLSGEFAKPVPVRAAACGGY